MLLKRVLVLTGKRDYTRILHPLDITMIAKGEKYSLSSLLVQVFSRYGLISSVVLQRIGLLKFLSLKGERGNYLIFSIKNDLYLDESFINLKLLHNFIF